MNKILCIVFMVFSLISCSPERTSTKGNGSDTNQDKLEKYRRKYDVEEVVRACTDGCLYNYKLYRSAKSLLNSSVSLNQAQLDSVNVVCSRHCESTFLDELKNIKESVNKNADTTLKKSIENEEDEDVPVEKTSEKREEKSNVNDDLKGFEDL